MQQDELDLKMDLRHLYKRYNENRMLVTKLKDM